MSISLIVPAAGSGKRMASEEKKQFLSLEGCPIIIRTLKAFQGFKEIKRVIVVTAKEDLAQMQALVQSYSWGPEVLCIEGGKERQDSVYEGLKLVETPYVMVHDGARPFVKSSIIEGHIQGLKDHRALITALAVRDTIKEVKDGRVRKTLDRSTLVQVQTPQSFHTRMLKDAYDYGQSKGLVVTDDAALVEAFGQEVYTVEGSPLNIKVTVQEDLLLGAWIVRR